MDALDNYKTAIALYEDGKHADCLQLLLKGYEHVRGSQLKIAYLQTMVILIDPVFKIDGLFTLCNEGIRIAGEINETASLAYFQMKKAYFCVLKIFLQLSVKKEVILAPDRMNFSLESDKDLHDAMISGISSLEQQSEELVSLVETTSDKENLDLQAHIHSILGDVYGTKASIYMLEHLRHSKILNYFGKFGLKLRHVLPLKEKVELQALSDRCIREFLLSVDYYKKNNDTVGAACAYSSISNNIRLLGYYRKAKQYLALSKQVSSAKSILGKRTDLEASVMNKDKDIPDYKKQLPRSVLRRNTATNLKLKLKDWLANK